MSTARFRLGQGFSISCVYAALRLKARGQSVSEPRAFFWKSLLSGPKMYFSYVEAGATQVPPSGSVVARGRMAGCPECSSSHPPVGLLGLSSITAQTNLKLQEQV